MRLVFVPFFIDNFFSYKYLIHCCCFFISIVLGTKEFRARTFISKSLNDLFKKAGGKGKLQFKNWNMLKRRWNIEIIGWPADVPLVAVNKLKVRKGIQ